MSLLVRSFPNCFRTPSEPRAPAVNRECPSHPSAASTRGRSRRGSMPAAASSLPVDLPQRARSSQCEPSFPRGLRNSDLLVVGNGVRHRDDGSGIYSTSRVLGCPYPIHDSSITNPTPCNHLKHFRLTYSTLLQQSVLCSLFSVPRTKALSTTAGRIYDTQYCRPTERGTS
jgi:hypothetical protein